MATREAIKRLIEPMLRFKLVNSVLSRIISFNLKVEVNLLIGVLCSTLHTGTGGTSAAGGSGTLGSPWLQRCGLVSLSFSLSVCF